MENIPVPTFHCHGHRDFPYLLNRVQSRHRPLWTERRTVRLWSIVPLLAALNAVLNVLNSDVSLSMIYDFTRGMLSMPFHELVENVWEIHSNSDIDGLRKSTVPLVSFGARSNFLQTFSQTLQFSWKIYSFSIYIRNIIKFTIQLRRLKDMFRSMVNCY